MLSVKSKDTFNISGRGKAFVIPSPVNDDQTPLLGLTLLIDGIVYTINGVDRFSNLIKKPILIGDNVAVATRPPNQLELFNMRSLSLYQKVKKVGGSYEATGTIRSVFEADDGSPRYVFRFDNPPGLLHIFSNSNLKPLDNDDTTATSDGAVPVS